MCHDWHDSYVPSPALTSLSFSGLFVAVVLALVVYVHCVVVLCGFVRVDVDGSGCAGTGSEGTA